MPALFCGTSILQVLLKSTCNQPEIGYCSGDVTAQPYGWNAIATLRSVFPYEYVARVRWYRYIRSDQALEGLASRLEIIVLCLVSSRTDPLLQRSQH